MYGDLHLKPYCGVVFYNFIEENSCWNDSLGAIFTTIGQDPNFEDQMGKIPAVWTGKNTSPEESMPTFMAKFAYLTMETALKLVALTNYGRCSCWKDLKREC